MHSTPSREATVTDLGDSAAMRKTSALVVDPERGHPTEMSTRILP